MDLTYSPEDEAFRAEVRAWLEDNLAGEFAELRGTGGPGREHEAYDERAGLGPAPRRARLDLPRLARGVRRPRAAALSSR